MPPNTSTAFLSHILRIFVSIDNKTKRKPPTHTAYTCRSTAKYITIRYIEVTTGMYEVMMWIMSFIAIVVSQ